MKKIMFVVNSDSFFISHRLHIAKKALEQKYEVHIATAIADGYPELRENGFIVHPIDINRSSWGSYQIYFFL